MEAGSMKRQAVRRLEAEGFQRVLVYQPQHKFIDNGRKLKSVAEPGDPWMASAIWPEHDICFSAEGSTATEAADMLIRSSRLPQIYQLGRAIDMLTTRLTSERRAIR